MSREVINLNRYIDHTLLKPTASINQLEVFCKSALEYDFRSVCIPSYFVKKAESILQSSTTSVCTVIGFPLGYSLTESKLFQVRKAIEDGAEELDVVINQSWVKSEDWNALHEEMDTITQYIHKYYGIVKWIVETSNLSIVEQKKLCSICMEIQADYIKTSTGFAEKGAQLADVKRWKKQIGNHSLKIKASGGIKNSTDACNFIAGGADRIGCSAGISIINEYNNG